MKVTRIKYRLEDLLTTRGDIAYRAATLAARLAKGTSGQFLKQGVNDPAWANAYLIDLLTTPGQMVYRGATAPAVLAKGTQNHYLRQGASYPEWAANDVGYGRLTVLGFQSNPGIGTMDTPQKVNDTETGTDAEADAVDEYGEVIFAAALEITQYRYWSYNVDHIGDGKWKLQYMNLAGIWTDWVTDIPTLTTDGFSNWASGATVVALGIRVVCTTVDTCGAESAVSYLNELEVKY